MGGGVSMRGPGPFSAPIAMPFPGGGGMMGGMEGFYIDSMLPVPPPPTPHPHAAPPHAALLKRGDSPPRAAPHSRRLQPACLRPTTCLCRRRG